MRRAIQEVDDDLVAARAKNPQYKPTYDTCVLVQKTRVTAELPFQECQSDVIFNVVLINRSDDRAEDDTNAINFFETGLVFKPPPGSYIMLTASYELYNRGYMLPTPVIINPEDENDVRIPLYKYREGADIELPFTGVQMTVHKAYYPNLMHVTDMVSKASARAAAAKRPERVREPGLTRSSAPPPAPLVNGRNNTKETKKVVPRTHMY
jgi:hypothetical protein